MNYKIETDKEKYIALKNLWRESFSLLGVYSFPVDTIGGERLGTIDGYPIHTRVIIVPREGLAVYSFS